VQHSIRELLTTAFRTAEIDDWEQYVESDPRYKRPAEVFALHGSYAKAKEKLGWEPKTEFKDMISFMVKEDIRRLSRDIR
jgi:GDPmannose 4,6-dehydratase